MTITFNFTNFLVVCSLLLSGFTIDPSGMVRNPSSPVESTALKRLAPTDLAVYHDALTGSWGDWSWNVAVNLNNSNPVHDGTRSIALTFNQGWAGFQLGRNNSLDVSDYDTLRFWIHGGSAGNQTVEIQVSDGCAQVIHTVHPAANVWTLVEVSL